MSEQEPIAISELQWLEILWNLSRKERKFYKRLMEIRMALNDKKLLLEQNISTFVQQMVSKYVTEPKETKKT